jgi:hypothetical protein
VPVTPQTLFHIASTTKPLTGTAVMRLVERGELDLDRPVRGYVPWPRLGREDAAARGAGQRRGPAVASRTVAPSGHGLTRVVGASRTRSRDGLSRSGRVPWCGDVPDR